MDAFKASKPTDVAYGTVVGVSPLEIKIDQQLTLDSAQLVLCRTVTTPDALQIGEGVVMIQVAGGQKYVVIDRI